MGNEIEIDLNKYNCSCIQKEEEGCFLGFFNEMKATDAFNIMTTPGKYSKSELQENTPGGIYYPNDNMAKTTFKKIRNKNKKLKILDLFDSENDSSEINKNIKNNKNTINNKSNINSINNSILNEEDQKEKDIKEFDKKTNYYLLANQINNAINELKMNLYSNNEDKMTSSQTPNINMDIYNEYLDFEKAIKRAGKAADKIIFNNIVNILKKITDIHSEVILMQQKIYLGIANKFKKEKNDKFLINYEDEEKIVDLPNFEEIKEKNRLKLGDKYNNSKFKFNRFAIKGSFPNEILIWNLISQNTQKIADVLTENYYCCLVLLYYSKVEEENETIMYLINKPTN